MKEFSIVVVFLLFFSCSVPQEAEPFDGIKNSFIANLNQQKNIEKYYWRQGGLFINEQLYKDRDSIELHLKKIAPIHRFESIALVKHDSSNCFEMGYYLSDSSTQKTAYLIAWKKEKDNWVKELEILYPFQIQTPVPTSVIDAARTQWENLSNAHQPDSLAQQIYTPNCFYFNDGYIYRGAKELTEKYSYMSKKNWHIRLATKSTTQVTDSLFYDVGQYVSSGIGHYVIVWQLQENGVWKVLLDFNF